MKIPILIRCARLAGGGAEKSLYNLLKFINYKKFSIDILIDEPKYKYEDLFPKQVRIFHKTNNLSSIFTNKIKKYAWHYLAPLFYRWVLKKKYALEIAYFENTVDALLGSPLKESKKIVWVHTHIAKHCSPSKKKYFLEAFKKVDSLVAVSQGVKQTLLEEESTLAPKIYVIENIVDVQEIRKQANIPLNDPHLDPQHLKIVYVGRLTVKKGIDHLISSCDRLYKNGLNFQLILVGDLSVAPEDQILDFNKSFIYLTGFHYNPYSYLNQADIFVQSSKSESYSLSVAEAMVLQKPIVCTYDRGPDALLKQGEYGMLVENSEQGLYNGLKKMLENPELRERYRKKLSEITYLFNAQDNIKIIEQFFFKMLDK